MSVGDPIATLGNDQLKGSSFDLSPPKVDTLFGFPGSNSRDTTKCRDDIAVAYMEMVVVAEMELEKMGNASISKFMCFLFTVG